jgi:hypothetical protein
MVQVSVGRFDYFAETVSSLLEVTLGLCIEKYTESVVPSASVRCCSSRGTGRRTV